MLKIFANAVGKMKTTEEGSPLGWTFQWYTHWVPPDFQPKSKADEIARIYPGPGAWRDLAQEMWNTCQAHDPAHPENEDFFLPWHRLYLAYFEKMVRTLSGDDSFTLPYWDYSAADQTIRGVIPPEFTKDGDAVFGSLFVKNRNKGVNQGQPIQQGQIGDPLSLEALAQCLYSPEGAEPGFCMNLDGTIHGNVHVLVGDRKNMGFVPFAARDPIFWLHHCNIDRLWASWNAAGRANPALSRSYVFADEKGKRTVGKAEDVLNLAKLDYTYDRLEQVPDCPTTPAAIRVAGEKRKRRAMVKQASVKLGPNPVTVTLEPLAEQKGEKAKPFPLQFKALAKGKRLYLVVKDLKTEVQPGVLYDLFLELPAKATDAQRKAHHIGVLNFFNAHGHQKPGHEEAAKNDTGRFLRYDITRLAKELQSQNVLKESPTLTIAPSGQPDADAHPVIGEIAIVEQ
jgi:tyrosinase